MRIALIHVGQETNDFNPLPTTLRDYASFGILEGADVVQRFRTLGQIGGYVQAAEASGLQIETVPIVRGWAVAGGRIDRESYDFFDRKIREGLKAAGTRTARRPRKKRSMSHPRFRADISTGGRKPRNPRLPATT